jgi:CheY-like chemotaxis protein
MLLASCGAEVRTASSAREAMDIAARWIPDVVVSDLAMPEEDGYSLLATMRAQGQPLGSVPVIALTAYSARAIASRRCWRDSLRTSPSPSGRPTYGRRPRRAQHRRALSLSVTPGPLGTAHSGDGESR